MPLLENLIKNLRKDLPFAPPEGILSKPPQKGYQDPAPRSPPLGGGILATRTTLTKGLKKAPSRDISRAGLLVLASVWEVC